MENTGKVLFEDTTPQWYVALGTAWMGPLAAADVHAKVVRQEISWAHFIWKQGQKNWQRICDMEPFRAMVPHAPSTDLVQAVRERSRELGATKKPPPPPAEAKEEDQDRKIWYLYFNETQFGPFSAAEVGEYIAAGRVHARVYAWRDGMEGWERLDKVVAFARSLAARAPVIQPAQARNRTKAAVVADGPQEPAIETSQPAQEPEDKRGAPRKPMVARILLANDREVTAAVCRDVSVGGMQVLTDKLPGEVGSRIKLNVSPVTGRKPDFKPFVAEGTIVRLLEDGRGFSFRFSRLSDSARRAIEAYIKASA